MSTLSPPNRGIQCLHLDLHLYGIFIHCISDGWQSNKSQIHGVVSGMHYKNCCTIQQGFLLQGTRGRCGLPMNLSQQLDHEEVYWPRKNQPSLLVGVEFMRCNQRSWEKSHSYKETWYSVCELMYESGLNYSQAFSISYLSQQNTMGF